MDHSEDELESLEDKCRFLYDLNFYCNYDRQYLDHVTLKYHENIKRKLRKKLNFWYEIATNVSTTDIIETGYEFLSTIFPAQSFLKIIFLR